MDGIANVAKMQQSQVRSQESEARAAVAQQQVQQPKQVDVVKEMQKENSSSSQKINSKEQVQDLIEELTSTALEAINRDEIDLQARKLLTEMAIIATQRNT